MISYMNDHSAVTENSRLRMWGQCLAKVGREEISENVTSLGLRENEPNKELGKVSDRKKYVQMF